MYSSWILHVLADFYRFMKDIAFTNELKSEHFLCISLKPLPNFCNQNDRENDHTLKWSLAQIRRQKSWNPQLWSIILVCRYCILGQDLILRYPRIIDKYIMKSFLLLNFHCILLGTHLLSFVVREETVSCQFMHKEIWTLLQARTSFTSSHLEMLQTQWRWNW